MRVAVVRQAGSEESFPQGGKEAGLFAHRGVLAVVSGVLHAMSAAVGCWVLIGDKVSELTCNSRMRAGA